MDQNDRDQRVSGPPKDFIALSHGQEWVAFYESFDKLVQDNLARSSELLRRAMSLPEVADREVQQIRSEMEGKLAAERDKQKALLGVLQGEISGSHRQVANLARSVGAVMSDLERLNQRVTSALAAYDNGGSAVDAETAAHSVAPSYAAPANGTGSLPSGRVGTGTLTEARETTGPLSEGRVGTGSLASAPAAPAVVEPEPFVAPEADSVAQPEAEASFEPEGVDPFASEFDLSDIAAAVEEQQALLDAAEQQLDHLEESIDLSSMAEADATAEPAATAPAAAMANSEHRPRPHWLSVTRVGSQSS